MPADTALSQRRAARQHALGDGGPDSAKLRGVEAKRARGEIACAECRRFAISRLTIKQLLMNPNFYKTKIKVR